MAFDEKTAEFNIAFFAVNRGINTYDLYFEPYLNNQPYNGEPLLTVNDAPVTLSFRAYADNYLGDKSQESYIEFAYTMKPDEYMVDFDINMVGMKDIIPSNTNFLTLDWNVDLLQQERLSIDITALPFIINTLMMMWSRYRRQVPKMRKKRFVPT